MTLPQVWVCSTNIPLPSQYQSFLSSEEITRSQRFKSSQAKSISPGSGINFSQGLIAQITWQTRAIL